MTNRKAIFTAAAAVLALLPVSVCAGATGAPVWAAGGTFQPLSNTAESVTGPLILEGKRDGRITATFDAAKVDLVSAGIVTTRWNDTDERPVEGELFALSPDPGALRNGNTLCGADIPATHVVLFVDNPQDISSRALVMDVFSGKDAPRDLSSEGLCGIYRYIVE